MTKSRKDKMYHNYRIIVEMFFSKLEGELSRADRNGYYFTNSKNIQASKFFEKLIELDSNGVFSICENKFYNKNIMKLLSNGIDGFKKINEGSHYDESNIHINEIKFEEQMFVLKSIVFCLNRMNDKAYFISEEKIKELKDWQKRFNNQTRIIPEGSYVTTSKFDLFSVLEADEGIVIPFYQRAFVWEEDEIKQFLKSKEYYRGSIMTKLSSDGWVIIDGQQRLTTMFILMMLLFPESGYEFNKTFIYETSINDLTKDHIKLEKTTKIVNDYINSISPDEISHFKNLVKYSYFTVVGLTNDEQEVANFRTMNIASKPFTKPEVNRMIFIDKIFEKSSKSEKSINKLKKSISVIEENDFLKCESNLELYWISFNYHLHNDFDKLNLELLMRKHLALIKNDVILNILFSDIYFKNFQNYTSRYYSPQLILEENIISVIEEKIMNSIFLSNVKNNLSINETLYELVTEAFNSMFMKFVDRKNESYIWKYINEDYALGFDFLSMIDYSFSMVENLESHFVDLEYGLSQIENYEIVSVHYELICRFIDFANFISDKMEWRIFWKWIDIEDYKKTSREYVRFNRKNKNLPNFHNVLVMGQLIMETIEI